MFPWQRQPLPTPTDGEGVLITTTPGRSAKQPTQKPETKSPLLSYSCHSPPLLYHHRRDRNKTSLLFFLEIPLSRIFQAPLRLWPCVWVLAAQIRTESDECFCPIKSPRGPSGFVLWTPAGWLWLEGPAGNTSQAPERPPEKQPTDLHVLPGLLSEQETNAICNITVEMSKLVTRTKSTLILWVGSQRRVPAQLTGGLWVSSALAQDGHVRL